MCSNQSPIPSPNMAPTASVLPYPVSTIKPFEGNSTAQPPISSIPTASGLLPIDQYRLQLYNYAMVERLRFSNFGNYNNQLPFCPGYPYNPRLALQMSLFHNRVFQPEEPKPQHSYIGLIAMAILSSPESKLVLSDIYQYILDNYPYFRSRGPGWRNSIRHNLSLNDCFIKAGRSANGKGHYWAIHPANVEDFKKGDFRRRKAQRKVRKHMGLAVDEEGDDSPSPPPVPLSPPPPRVPLPGLCPWPTLSTSLGLTNSSIFPPIPNLTRKRQFDVASLLAPDEEKEVRKQPKRYDESYLSSSDEIEPEEDIDVVSDDSKQESRNPSEGNARTEEDGRENEEEKAKEGRSPLQRIYVRNLTPSGTNQDSSPTSSPNTNQFRSDEHSQHRTSPASPQPAGERPTLPIWIRQPSLIHPTAVFPSTLSFMEQQQQIVNRFYEQRIAVAQQQQQRRLFQQQSSDLSPVNLKNEET